MRIYIYTTKPDMQPVSTRIPIPGRSDAFYIIRAPPGCHYELDF